MNIVEITIDEFDASTKVTHVYNTVEFLKLNRGKCDSLTVLLFNDGKDRFWLPYGLRGRKAYSPFSAPFGGIISNATNLKAPHFRACAVALKEYINGKDFEEFDVSFAPTCYNDPFYGMIITSLLGNGFILNSIDINHHFDLTKSEHDFRSHLSIAATKQLRQAIENKLTFEVVENRHDFVTAYQIIARNRAEKGYTLSMSLEEVLQTCDVVRAHVFLIRDLEGIPIAAAICFEVTDSVVQVIYWGAIQSSNHLRPMNFLAFKVYMFFAELGFRLLDIGPSSKHGDINDGLADFKVGIGCYASLKFNLSFDKRVS